MTAQNLLVEIGTEELPPKSLRKLAEAFAANLTQELESLELAHQGVSWYASPRRLGLQVKALEAKQQDKEVEKRQQLKQHSIVKATLQKQQWVGHAVVVLR